MLRSVMQKQVYLQFVHVLPGFMKETDRGQTSGCVPLEKLFFTDIFCQIYQFRQNMDACNSF